MSATTMGPEQQDRLAEVPPSQMDQDNQSDTSIDDDLSPSVTTPPSSASIPSLRPDRNMTAGITASSTHLGQVNAARRGVGTAGRPHPSMSGAQPGGLNQDILAKMKAFSLSRQGAPPHLPHAVSTGTIPTSRSGASGSPGPMAGQSPSVMNGPLAGAFAGRLPPTARPNTKNWVSSPSIPGASSPQSSSPRPGGLAAKRMKPGLKLSDATGSNSGPADNSSSQNSDATGGSAFSKYSEYIDTKAGTLNFKNKAILHGGGVEFSSGHSFSISLDEVERLDELGKGNYGTVYKVRHSRPQMRKPGMGLRGVISRPAGSDNDNSAGGKPPDNLSGYIMAMKEIRLELDENKFAQIIMELDILHRCVSPFIIDFYGAFFQEGAVYMCVEYMDGGSIDKLYKDGMPENILRKVALSTVMGLKTLKDDHNIIHRDVKPTNILVNSRGQIKICDFGVSGNLVASIAKTNIGCQSYMAPERIAGGGVQQSGAPGGGTYSVQSDIWSLGLTLIECAIGRYPYPPETFNNIFSQLHAIVHGDPPTLPETGYSEEAQSFIRACLDKNASKRPSYSMLLRHPWLAPLMKPPTQANGADETPVPQPDTHPGPSTVTEDEEVAAWVKERLERRQQGLLPHPEKPALHAVALDAVPGSPLLDDPSHLAAQS
ncbi:mitogen-activated protein kinase kinase PBS2 [Aspergillus clavatus NRRL 1]|uniref:mitogen-activated protein kinase kinase n=1 Tax=Aspergillus clavatus (strain ATCC 1007 / CBS 513.65 / DSM 816 / NCTC 3887 / NRRL 1 / QM 1276 / 107) TaxID=344612 RepID=A1CNL3_ASPCL|nr:MAP kinase kinase (Pbs2), putative [Aspergillus clavatus NRRL 1]EAW07234.1 MAP kinase kinase (Pbs2), putative [Aspergillus clavatus NRRL 1]